MQVYLPQQQKRKKERNNDFVLASLPSFPWFLVSIFQETPRYITGATWSERALVFDRDVGRRGGGGARCLWEYLFWCQRMLGYNFCQLVLLRHASCLQSDKHWKSENAVTPLPSPLQCSPWPVTCPNSCFPTHFPRISFSSQGDLKQWIFHIPHSRLSFLRCKHLRQCHASKKKKPLRTTDKGLLPIPSGTICWDPRLLPCCTRKRAIISKQNSSEVKGMVSVCIMHWSVLQSANTGYFFFPACSCIKKVLKMHLKTFCLPNGSSFNTFLLF